MTVYQEWHRFEPPGGAAETKPDIYERILVGHGSMTISQLQNQSQDSCKSLVEVEGDMIVFKAGLVLRLAPPHPFGQRQNIM